MVLYWMAGVAPPPVVAVSAVTTEESAVNRRSGLLPESSTVPVVSEQFDLRCSLAKVAKDMRRMMACGREDFGKIWGGSGCVKANRQRS